MSDTVPIKITNIEGYFETTTPFEIRGDKFFDDKNNQIDDISSIFTFKMYDGSDKKITEMEENKLYEVVMPEVKVGGKSKKKRGGNKRKTKSNRNKR